jgi:hypothetical protein
MRKTLTLKCGLTILEGNDAESRRIGFAASKRSEKDLERLPSTVASARRPAERSASTVWPFLAFTISRQAGPRVAAIVSIVETCRRLNVAVRNYLGSVFPGLANFPINRVPELTPVA